MMEGANQEDDSATLMPRMDKALLTDFVDRWRPETHTFHLPFGSLWQDDSYTQGYRNAHWLADKGQASGFTVHWQQYLQALCHIQYIH
jgi:hypothetical protein